MDCSAEQVLAGLKADHIRRRINRLRDIRGRISASDVDEAMIYQSDLYRQLAIIDCAQQEVEARDGLEDGSGDAASNLLIQDARKEAKATVEDLPKMPIPVIKRSLESFPRYLDLPQVIVREKILGYLTNPQDKLNMYQANPTDAELMKWSEKNLQWELVLRCMARRGILDLQDVFNLSQVSVPFRDMMARQCEDKLVQLRSRRLNDPFSFGVDPSELGEEFKLSPNSQVDSHFALNPFPILVKVGVYEYLYDEEEDITWHEIVRYVMDSLKEYGKQIWDGDVSLEYKPEEPDRHLKFLAECLSLMPYLRRLSVSGGWLPETTGLDKKPESRLFEDVVLPELKYLKSLKLDDIFYPESRVVADKMLEKYSATLTHLEVSFEPFNNDEGHRIVAPNLRSLTVSAEMMDHCLHHLRLFQTSLLKEVILKVSGNNIETEFSKLLNFLGVHFASTLERLTLHFKVFEPNRDVPKPPPRFTGILGYDFPKVKYLNLDNFAKGWTFNFLLFFPALKELVWEMYSIPGEDFFQPGSVLGLSFDKDQMLSANVWKLLPYLEEVSITPNPWKPSRKMWSLARRECAYFQKHGVLIPVSKPSWKKRLRTWWRDQDYSGTIRLILRDFI